VSLQLRQLLAHGSRDGACLRPLLDEQQQANALQQQQVQEAQQQLQQAQDTIAHLQAQLANARQ
jgi:molecular chaperone GrpE (heat shock protein)